MTQVEALAGRWAPDGARVLFVGGSTPHQRLTIANVSGGRWTSLTDADSVFTFHTWSPDGQWIAFLRRDGGKQQLVKMKPAAGAAPVVLTNAAPAAIGYSMIQWAPTGDWIAYPSAEGISMISPDGTTNRKLSARKLLAFTCS